MSENYKPKMIDDAGKTALISLPKNVLGGDDALNFSNSVNSLTAEIIENLIIDLGDVDIMNSSGLGMLVASLTAAKNKGINLFLVRVPAKVKKLLVMTHLDKVFRQFDTLEEAISFSK